MTDTPPRLWTAEEVANYLRFSVKTVKRWASEEPDKLPPRIAGMPGLRWEPGVCVAWAQRKSVGEAMPVQGQAHGGRRRVR